MAAAVDLGIDMGGGTGTVCPAGICDMFGAAGVGGVTRRRGLGGRAVRAAGAAAAAGAVCSAGAAGAAAGAVPQVGAVGGLSSSGMAPGVAGLVITGLIAAPASASSFRVASSAFREGV